MSDFRKNDSQKKGVEIKSFQPRNLGGEGIRDYSEIKKSFGSLSGVDPEGNSEFNLNPAAKHFLGVERQEKSHVENLVKSEVEAQLSLLRDEAHREGYESGRKEGIESALEEHRQKVTPLYEQISSLIEGFDGLKKDLFHANEAFLVQLIFQIGKQILLKELSTDREYVKRLTTHVVEKVGAKDQIRIKVSRQDFENIEAIKDFLKSRIPDLKNIQIEGTDDLSLGGCKVETDLSRINASVENQFKSIEAALGET
jgi:flagellar assembly protein FliH